MGKPVYCTPYRAAPVLSLAPSCADMAQASAAFLYMIGSEDAHRNYSGGNCGAGEGGLLQTLDHELRHQLIKPDRVVQLGALG
jgi:hypothetical protein